MSPSGRNITHYNDKSGSSLRLPLLDGAEMTGETKRIPPGLLSDVLFRGLFDFSGGRLDGFEGLPLALPRLRLGVRERGDQAVAGL